MNLFKSLAPLMISATLALPMFDQTPTLRPQTWEQLEAQVEKSIVYIEKTMENGDVYSCTGFVINKGYVLTANHCVDMPFTVEGQPSTVVHAAAEFDIAVVTRSGEKKPALRHRDAPVHYGTPIAALGYAYGLPLPTLKAGIVALPAISFTARDRDDPTQIELGPWTMMDFPVIPGMSGGPVFDQEGRVAGVVLRTDSFEGTTRPLHIMLAVAGPYWK